MRFQLAAMLLSLLATTAVFGLEEGGRVAEKAFLAFESGHVSLQKNVTLKRAEVYGFPAARVHAAKDGGICEITVVTMDDKFELVAGQKYDLIAYSKDECASHKHLQDREDCLAKQGRFLRLQLPPRKSGGERLAWLYCDGEANLDRSIDEFKKSHGISLQIQSRPPEAPVRATVTEVIAEPPSD